MHNLMQDLRYAVRTLRRSSLFTFGALFVLALGIGAATLVFSLVDGVLLRPLAYPSPEQLVRVVEAHPKGGRRPVSYPTFTDWRREARGFSRMAYLRGSAVALAGTEGAERLTAAYVSDDFFPLLATTPLIGRPLTVDDGQPGATPTVVLSYGLWQRRFGGERAVLGQSLSLGSVQAVVVGVMPAGVTYPAWADLWMPLSVLPNVGPALVRRDLHVDSELIGRLRPTVDLADAQVELTRFARRLAEAYPAEQEGWTEVGLTALADDVIGDARPKLQAMGLAVALVLLIACANIASLLLVRVTGRRREIAVRTALGAGRGRLIRQLMTESATLAVGGAGLGSLLAVWGVELLRRAAPTSLPRLAELTVDGRVLLFTAGLAIVTTLLIGLLPARRATASDLMGTLRSGPSGTDSRRNRRVQGGLVVAELALALVLLVGAGLLTRSFWQLTRADLGFQPDRLVMLRVFPPSPRYATPESALTLYRRLEGRIAELPDVASVALTNHLPLSGTSMGTPIQTPGQPVDPENPASALYRTVSADYFRTMQIPVRRGRVFTAADMAGDSPAILVNETLARAVWPNLDPIGQTLTANRSAQGRADFGQPIQGTVVGVVGDVRHFGPRVEPVAEVYLPVGRNVWPNIYLIARTRDEAPEAAMAAIRAAVAEIDPDIPLTGSGTGTSLQPVEQLRQAARTVEQLYTTLLAGFAAVALLLTAVGLGGVVAQSVSGRTREIGVRVALGAAPVDVLRLVLTDAVKLTALGLALGLGLAVGLTRLLTSLLYGVDATDPLTFALIPMALAVVALTAAYLPARRATQIDPVAALRAE